LAATSDTSPKFACEVVQIQRAQEPPGRFLARKHNSLEDPGSVKAAGNVWFDIGDKKGQRKGLTVPARDVIPFKGDARDIVAF
jgi:hypothetical protein